MEIGRSEGRTGTYNQWVIDSLTEGDVCVVDMYDKIYKGTFLGGNLTTAIAGKTKTGGGVILGRNTRCGADEADSGGTGLLQGN